MTNFTAVYDACVLYPAPLRDLLMRLAVTDLFRAKWTEAIHDEWTRSVLRDRPDLSADQLQRTRTLMNDNVRDCLVTGYEELIPALHLPDPDDRHVEMAIKKGATVAAKNGARWFGWGWIGGASQSMGGIKSNPWVTLSRLYAGSAKDRSFTQCRQLGPAATVATGIPAVPVLDYRFDDGFLVHLDDGL